MHTFIRSICLFGCLLLHGMAVQAERYTIPLLVSAPTTGAPQGVLRILNGTDESGMVEIYAISDAGTRSGPATFTLNASAAVQFTATDLQSGNATLGLTGGIGTGVGDARLQIETDLFIVPLAFVRAADGTLSAMHDTVRGASVGGSDGYTYEVPTFNPASEVTQVSRLRLINPGDAAATVTIGGRDDSGDAATGGDVTLTLAAGGSQTLTAQQLEAGDTAVTGRLGAGTGKWRLTVSSDQPLQVVNIVAATAGYWNNLSTTAVPGVAPADIESLNERFVGNAVVFETGSSRFTLDARTGKRFTEKTEMDGVSSTSMGSYGYARIGPDAGRLTLTYDDGDVCAVNLYFSTQTAGWFASHCTGSDEPAEGTWLGGNWSVGDSEDDGGEVTETAYGVDDALPGVPTSGSFVPAALSGGSVMATGTGTTIALNDGGYFELSDGSRYTCTSAGGCTVANGTVTAGSITGRAAGTGEVDRFPSFRGADAPGDRTYTVDTAIETLTLPAASGGNGTLSYNLTPPVPGLTFDAVTRRLTGTPSTAGTYAVTYTVTDEDGDTDTLGFTITVNEGSTGPMMGGDCYVGLRLGPGDSCNYPGTTDMFSVNERGRGSFLGRLAGIRIRINNETIDGRDYDFEASHQGDGVWRIDRIAGSTEEPAEPPMTGGGGMEPENTSPSFPAGSGPGNQTYTVGTAIATLTLPEASGGDGTLSYSLSPDVLGLTFNGTSRALSGAPTIAGSYNMTYSVTDDDDDTASLGFTITVEEVDDGTGVAEGFALYAEGLSTGATSLAWGNGRFYILDRPALKVFAYSAAGERDTAADFDLIADNSRAAAMVYANGRFHVVDSLDDKVYAYSASGQREAAADFDLIADNADPAAITYANGRFYVLDFIEEKAYAYSATGQHEAEDDFDLNLDFPVLWGITYANDRFHVLDWGTQRVHAYSPSGERAPAADFDLRSGNAFPQGIVYANGRFHVLDWRHEKVYAYSATGQSEAGADFNLHVNANSRPTGISYADSRFYVADYADLKVYSYSASGEREAATDFDLSLSNSAPLGIAHGNSRFYVADADDTVYAYTTSGQHESTANFDLHSDNRNPSGITYANGRFHVVDVFDDKVYAYSAAGRHEATADFDLSAENTSPEGIAYAGGRFYVVDTSDDKVYAYSVSGEHDAAADFDLHADNAYPRGITDANDRLHVVDLYSGRVHEYAVPVASDGSGETGPGSPTGLLVLSKCSDGTYVNDPGGNPGLVGDCQALVRIANAFAEGRELPAGHILRQWGSGEQERIEQWSGVQVTGGRVTRLILDNSQLIGTIPAAIGELTALQVLSLAGNELSGAVPAEIGALTSLTSLDLSSNELTDIAALARNAQWGDGVRFDLSDNALNDESLDTHIPALIARGVAVNHDVRLVDEFPDSRLYQIYNDNVAIMSADGDLTAAATYGANLAAFSADFYRWFQDEFDHLLFVSNLTRLEDQANVSYAGVYHSVMNDTQGIGQSMFFDNRYGSAGRLRGVLHFPYNISLRNGPSLHELLHAWANYAVPTVLRAHWGFSSANGQLGGFNIANLEDLGDGQWTAGRFGTFANGGNSLPYSPIELYFAGLLPREDVPDLWVAADGAWLRGENGAVATTDDGKPIFTAGNVRTYTIEDIVAERGERDPAMAERPHQRGAVILLIDDDHLPTSAELQTVSQQAAWLSFQGNDESRLYNYHEATGGRGSLTLDGLSGLRKSEAATQATPPASFGVLPPPRMTTVEELCEPIICLPAN